MSQPIILYDTPSKVPGNAFSGNMLKARRVAQLNSSFLTSEHMYTLAYKGLAFKSVWVELPDVEERMKAIGAKPTGRRPDGSDFYSLPTIQDPSTGPVFPVMAVVAAPKLYPRTEEYLKRQLEIRMSAKWEDISPVGPKREEGWKNIKAAFGVIDGWYSKSGGKWIMGDTFSYADVIVAAWMRSFSVLFDKEQWEDMKSWNGGRWGGIVEDINRYSILD
ncbi:hypothetical protein SERLA73DRAFT_162189 [Serpula lacrymans var. lacrymans S7.3]|uniref:Glutathione S-transferase UstS-like C-terminal domain-containing protein n=1 Tax=Serpula lacrymans var. lacrymans (strain S7.3) TaxID=936435 RepID=F8Q6W1_SERL3|nr:hypothetical protein SERLA73DRAFT_162189 [Serpula lacrymans var. lacrymans S7.3]